MSDSIVTTSGSYVMGSSGPYEYDAQKVYALLFMYTSPYPIYVWGADWYDQTWSMKDNSNAPSSHTVMYFDSCFDGQYIHVVTHSSTTIYYSRFDCETETWVLTDQTVTTQTSLPICYPSDKAMSVAVRPSDGRIFVAYTWPEPKKGYHLAYYAYSDNGTSWTDDQTIPSSPDSKEVEYHTNLWFDSNSIMYYLFKWTSVVTGYEQLLCYNGSSWSSVASLYTSSSLQPLFIFRPAEWDNSGSATITLGGEYAFAAKAVDLTGGSSPAWGTVQTVNANSDGGDLFEGRRMVLYDSMPILFTMNYDGGAYNDVYYVRRTGSAESAWGTPTQLESCGNPVYYMSSGQAIDSGYAVCLYKAGTNVVVKCYPSVPEKQISSMFVQMV